LLVVFLILNGVGNAVAGVAIPSMDGKSHAVMDLHHAPQPVASACGQDEGETLGIAAHVLSAEALISHPADCDQDCCAQGACGCPCVQLAQAMLFAVPVLSVQHEHIRLAAFFPVGHAMPALLHPIRPPIG